MFACRKEKLLAEYVIAIYGHLDFMLSRADLDGVKNCLLDVSSAFVCLLLHCLESIRLIIYCDSYILLCIVCKRNESSVLYPSLY